MLEKKRNSTHKQKKKYQADFGLQMKKGLYALEILESFIIVSVFILQFYSLYFQTNI